MNREFIMAVEELEKEKEISKELLIEAIESALVSAYKKNYGTSQNVRVNINKETGDIDVFMRKDIVDVPEDDLTEVSLEEAREIGNTSHSERFRKNSSSDCQAGSCTKDKRS